MPNRAVSRQAGAVPTSMDLNSYIYLFDDFMGSNVVNGIGWSTTVSGTGAATGQTSGGAAASRVGIWNISTGTTTTGRGGVIANSSGLFASGGSIVCRWAIQLPNLSDGTDTYNFQCGMGDNESTGDQTDGIYFLYDSTSSANWKTSTAAAGVRTQTASSTAVVAGAFVNLMMIVNAAGTNVDFYVNGVLIGSNTTNIPNTSSTLFGFVCKIEKSAGTNARFVLFDWFDFQKVLTTAR